MPNFPEGYYVNLPSIFVDDSDPTIRYNGTWNAVSESEIETASFKERVPIFNTLHVLPISSSGSWAYDFTGVSVSVFATPIDNTRYTSQCFLDGIPVNVNSSTTTANVGQSQPVCAVFGLAGNTVHTISVVVSVETPDHYDPLSGFAFDYILIVPEAGTSLWKSDSHDIFLPILSMVAIVNSSTPVANVGLYFSVGLEQIGHFTPDWEYDPLNGFQTTTPEARFTVTFTGRSIWWYGYARWFGLFESPNNSSISETSAVFAVDGGKNTNFAEFGAFASTLSQTYLFMTPMMENSTHSLAVVHRGSNASLPLTLQSLIIQRSALGALTPTSTGVPLVPSSSASKRTKAGIAGGIVGGAILLLLFISILYALSHRMRKKQRSIETGTQSTTVVPDPFPMPNEGNMPTSVPQKGQRNQQIINHHTMDSNEQPPSINLNERGPTPDDREHLSSPSVTIIQELSQSVSTINRLHIPHNSHLSTMDSDRPNGQSLPDLAITSEIHREASEGETHNGLRISYVPVLPPLYSPS